MSDSFQTTARTSFVRFQIDTERKENRRLLRKRNLNKGSESGICQVCMCVCVCGGERQRDIQRLAVIKKERREEKKIDREKGRESTMKMG